MRILNYLIICAGVILFFACSDEENPGEKSEDDCLVKKSDISGQVIEEQYIISLPPTDAGGRAASIEAILEETEATGAKIIESFEGEYNYHVVQLPASAAIRIKSEGRIRAIEPDRIISACGCFSVAEPRSITWNVEKVGYGDGTGKTAWVIDTGLDSGHPDLKVDRTRSRSFLSGNASFEDDNGHGTHIGGIIGALNNSIGTLGVASGANLVALKVLDKNGDGKLSALLNALTYIRNQAKAGDVVNISIGFPEVSATLEHEIQAIAGRGVYFTLAAGNEGKSANEFSPARTAGKNIYTVSAVDSLNRFAAFSNYGNDVIDFAAPGVSVLSTYTDGRYATLSGTSMAAPHVAGLLLAGDGKIRTVGSAANDPDGVGDPLAHL
ncbi:MAG TPA: S8 family serine peptidase [Chryseosolibacter sp.]|nr:S8 family serine peptidase [Chryseosolibacter sp.]